MTLPEAIENLERQIDPFAMPQDKGCQDALKLGIEAMKRVQHERLFSFSTQQALMPGEQPERTLAE